LATEELVLHYEKCWFYVYIFRGAVDVSAAVGYVYN